MSTPQHPIVMGIINVTPDSFAVSCTSMSEEEVLATASRALEEGATILDIGGQSTRPGATPISAEQEWARVEIALRCIRRKWPEVTLSVDTFYALVAERAVRDYGVQIINDVTAGSKDAQIWQVAADYHTPYILTYTREGEQRRFPLDVVADMVDFFETQTARLHQMGVQDIILDPGYGFGKTMEENFRCLNEQDRLLPLGMPVLAGISRKRMVYQTLGTTPAEALNGTTALHMVALMRGAHILRVHDVRETKETIALWEKVINNER